ncbi:hypothetical protein HK101_004356 [Irineochytrium annulatum]|nr:hypothetical protein HK101_004356 [Irineochytrium annulatum]
MHRISTSPTRAKSALLPVGDHLVSTSNSYDHGGGPGGDGVPSSSTAHRTSPRVTVSRSFDNLRSPPPAINTHHANRFSADRYENGGRPTTPSTAGCSDEQALEYNAITAHRNSPYGFALYLTISVISLGFVPLFSVRFPRIRTLVAHAPARTFREADWILVMGREGTYEEVKVVRVKDRMNMDVAGGLLLVGRDDIEETDECYATESGNELGDEESGNADVASIGGRFDPGRIRPMPERERTFSYFVYRKQRYRMTTRLSLSYTEIHALRSGLATTSAESLLLRNGPNTIDIDPTPTAKMIADKLAHPFYLFQVGSVVIWFYEGYVVYSIVILIMSALSVIWEVRTARKNEEALRELTMSSGQDAECTVLRNGRQVRLNPRELVVGDSVVIDATGPAVADMVLVQGGVVVDESTLTGEAVPVFKFPLPIVEGTGKSLGAESASGYAPEKNKGCTIFGGSRIVEIKPARHVLGKAGEESLAIGIVTATGFNSTKGELFRSILFPSQIERINFAGRVDVFCWDKTGTLTIPRLSFAGIERCENASLMGFSELLSRDFTNELERAVAACHTLNDVNGELLGPPLDLELFAATGWSLNQQESHTLVDNVQIPLVATLTPPTRKPLLDLKVFTSEPFQIGDGPEPGPNEPSQPGSTNVHVLKRFEFDAQIQRSSVVYYLPSGNGAQTGLRACVKGSPESIARICKPASLPANYQQAHNDYAARGFYVLSVAGRLFSSGPLSGQNGIKMEDVAGCKRDAVERDMEFLGFVLLQNPLKAESLPVVTILKEAGVKSVIITGDGPMTAISVVRELKLCDNLLLVDVFEQGIGFQKVKRQKSLQATEEEDREADVERDDTDARQESQSVQPEDFDEPSGEHHEPIQISIFQQLNLPVGSMKGNNTRFSGVPSNASLKGKRAESSAASLSVAKTTTVAMALSYPIEELGRTLAVMDQSAGRDDFQRPELTVTGPALETLIGCAEDGFLDWLVTRTRVFARMKPSQKTWVIERLMRQGRYVGMCGDGANDTGALKAAHVGLALSDAEASIVAPFTSARRNVTDVIRLISEGRCALNTSFIAFKYMFMYPIVQLAMSATLYQMGSGLSNNQYLFDDMAIVLVLAILMLRAAPARRLGPLRPTDNLFSSQILISIIGQLAICIGFFAANIASIDDEPWFCSVWKATAQLDRKTWLPLNASSLRRFFANIFTSIDPERDVNGATVFNTYENTAIWLFSHFQFVILSLAFCLTSAHRRPAWTNGTFVLYLIMISITLVLFLLLSEHNAGFELFSLVFNIRSGVSMEYRIGALFLAACNLAASVAWEVVVVDWIVNKWVMVLDEREREKEEDRLAARAGISMAVDGAVSPVKLEVSLWNGAAISINAVILALYYPRSFTPPSYEPIANSTKTLFVASPADVPLDDGVADRFCEQNVVVYLMGQLALAVLYSLPQKPLQYVLDNYKPEWKKHPVVLLLWTHTNPPIFWLALAEIIFFYLTTVLPLTFYLILVLIARRRRRMAPLPGTTGPAAHLRGGLSKVELQSLRTFLFRPGTAMGGGVGIEEEDEGTGLTPGGDVNRLLAVVVENQKEEEEKVEGEKEDVEKLEKKGERVEGISASADKAVAADAGGQSLELAKLESTASTTNVPDAEAAGVIAASTMSERPLNPSPNAEIEIEAPSPQSHRSAKSEGKRAALDAVVDVAGGETSSGNHGVPIYPPCRIEINGEPATEETAEEATAKALHHVRHPAVSSPSKFLSAASLPEVPTESEPEPEMPLPEGSTTNCAICFCDFEPGDRIRILACQHLFHVACVDPWLIAPEEDAKAAAHRTCPLCVREAILPEFRDPIVERHLAEQREEAEFMREILERSRLEAEEARRRREEREERRKNGGAWGRKQRSSRRPDVSPVRTRNSNGARSGLTVPNSEGPATSPSPTRQSRGRTRNAISLSFFRRGSNAASAVSSVRSASIETSTSTSARAPAATTFERQGTRDSPTEPMDTDASSSSAHESIKLEVLEHGKAVDDVDGDPTVGVDVRLQKMKERLSETAKRLSDPSLASGPESLRLSAEAARAVMSALEKVEDEMGRGVLNELEDHAKEAKDVPFELNFNFHFHLFRGPPRHHILSSLPATMLNGLHMHAAMAAGIYDGPKCSLFDGAAALMLGQPAALPLLHPLFPHYATAAEEDDDPTADNLPGPRIYQLDDDEEAEPPARPPPHQPPTFEGAIPSTTWSPVPSPMAPDLDRAIRLLNQRLGVQAHAPAGGRSDDGAAGENSAGNFNSAGEPIDLDRLAAIKTRLARSFALGGGSAVVGGASDHDGVCSDENGEVTASYANRHRVRSREEDDGYAGYHDDSFDGRGPYHDSKRRKSDDGQFGMMDMGGAGAYTGAADRGFGYGAAPVYHAEDAWPAAAAYGGGCGMIGVGGGIMGAMMEPMMEPIIQPVIEPIMGVPSAEEPMTATIEELPASPSTGRRSPEVYWTHGGEGEANEQGHEEQERRSATPPCEGLRRGSTASEIGDRIRSLMKRMAAEVIGDDAAGVKDLSDYLRRGSIVEEDEEELRIADAVSVTASAVESTNDFLEMSASTAAKMSSVEARSISPDSVHDHQRLDQPTAVEENGHPIVEVSLPEVAKEKRSPVRDDCDLEGFDGGRRRMSDSSTSSADSAATSVSLVASTLPSSGESVHSALTGDCGKSSSARIVVTARERRPEEDSAIRRRTCREETARMAFWPERKVIVENGKRTSILVLKDREVSLEEMRAAFIPE